MAILNGLPMLSLASVVASNTLIGGRRRRRAVAANVLMSLSFP